MTRADKILIATIFFCALIGFAQIYRHCISPLNEIFPRQATISCEGNILHTIDLHPAGEKRLLNLRGAHGTATVEVDGDQIRMLTASCPNQICVRQGWIERDGSSIVCLPGKFVIQIDGSTVVDAVSH